jgi:hypothetical protein
LKFAPSGPHTKQTNKEVIIERLVHSRDIDVDEHDLAQELDEHAEALEQARAALVEIGVRQDQMLTVHTIAGKERVQEVLHSLVNGPSADEKAKNSRKPASMPMIVIHSFCIHEVRAHSSRLGEIAACADEDL